MTRYVAVLVALAALVVPLAMLSLMAYDIVFDLRDKQIIYNLAGAFFFEAVFVVFCLCGVFVYAVWRAAS
jgi:hypothetical protein